MNNESKGLNIYQIEKYAKQVGSDSLEFFMMGKNGFVGKGKFLDAYFGMIIIPEIGEGFITLSSIIQEYGDEFFSFVPLE